MVVRHNLYAFRVLFLQRRKSIIIAMDNSAASRKGLAFNARDAIESLTPPATCLGDRLQTVPYT